MKLINTFLDACRDVVRKFMRVIARWLDRASGGRISPNGITIFALLMHVPVAWLIATDYYIWAAIGLLVFGLMDTLDGEVARLQKRTSNLGMLLDASTDRIKETLLYCAAAYSLALSDHPTWAMWAVAACGFSLTVSYVKAKGEVAVSGSLSPNEVNRLFQDGLMRFEIRMCLLIVGLLAGQLAAATIVIAVCSALTVVERLRKISQKLRVATGD